jgi:hypothetical protein
MTENEAREILATAGKPHVHLTDLPDGAIRIQVDAAAEKQWLALLVLALLGPAGLAAAWFIKTYMPAYIPLRFSAWLLVGLGAMATAMSLVFLLLLLVKGGPRDAIIEARAGELIAKGYIAGDHVVRYTPDTVRFLFAASHTLYVATRMGDQPVGGGAPPDAMKAIALLLAHRLWHGQQVGMRISRTLGFLPVERLTLGPVAETQPQSA